MARREGFTDLFSGDLMAAAEMVGGRGVIGGSGMGCRRDNTSASGNH
tara:strand:- start:988 stop:1128 length:141 start_codon:yes stop_codon:yes gene_type:complete